MGPRQSCEQLSWPSAQPATVHRYSSTQPILYLKIFYLVPVPGVCGDVTQHGVCQHVVPQQVVVVGQGVHQAVMGDSVGRMVGIVSILNILLSGVHVIHQVFWHKMII